MEWTLLLIVTFFAATVQASIGFGFGLIAVSAFLIMLDSIAAIQLVMIITLVMSIAHWPKLRALAPIELLKWLSLGCCVGFPLGIISYQLLDLEVIKALIATLIIGICLQNAWHLFNKKTAKAKVNTKQRPASIMAVGVISGAMATSMAMPGPSVMLYLTRTSLAKNQIRATVLTFFLFSYGGSLLLQSILIGVETSTWYSAAVLSPAALLGVVAGEVLAKKINQQYFHILVLLILLFTGVFMLLNL
jgi:uncharacterized membrane protein YfcA